MTQETKTKHVAWYLWPFWALWKLVSGIVLVTGRVVAVVLGLALMIAGVLLTITVVGAIVGIPLIVVSFLLVLRGLF